MRRLLGLALIALVLLSCNRENAPTQNQAASEVVVINIEAKDVPVSFEYVAQTQSSHLVNIQTRVNGFLEKRIYQEGALVKEGDILFLMDKKPFQAQVDGAQAALSRQQAAMETARLNLVRIKPLVALKALSQKDLDDANGTFDSTSAAVAQAKAQLEVALLNLSYCTIASPIDGVVSAALKQDGSYVDVSNSQLTTVSALSPIWVNFSISENQLLDFTNQMAKKKLIPPTNKEYVVKVIQSDGSVFSHDGKITFLEPYFNSDTGTFLIRATVDNPEGVLKPNQYVTARVEGAIRPKAVLVPQKAVQQSAKGAYVWVINKENKVEFRPVSLGDWHGSDWFITEGLWSGERVVVDGGLKLFPGAVVKIKGSS